MTTLLLVNGSHLLPLADDLEHLEAVEVIFLFGFVGVVSRRFLAHLGRVFVGEVFN